MTAHWRFASYSLMLLALCPCAAHGSAVEAADAGATWLEINQNADGSWGEKSAVAVLSTSEAVIALRAIGRHGDAYYRGITWLENHSMSSADDLARRILTLANHGDDVSADGASLIDERSLFNYDLVGPAWKQKGGWGLSRAYTGASLGTALAVLAFEQLDSDIEGSDLFYSLSGWLFLREAQTAGSDPGWQSVLASETEPATP